ncbi:mitogen-activated protein kinase kinase kinase 7 isoform X1 [Hydra vulgaris]|uniref:mitogen-activated protein kinase kinase kinase 7 isoform X1 n=1 Tax=Hydra vulgaris TaxID=6087 RepID=UPI0032EA5C48
MFNPNDNHNAIECLLLSPPYGFINKIGYNELSLCEVIGRGAYGTVQKAIWRNHMVAIKIPVNQNDCKEFSEEAKQLSIVQHRSIIQLYGTVINGPKLCLVMELADCGSLHNLLHPPLGDKTFHYTLAHVLSWALQCAEAVEYLHNIKPMPIIHRDLKPPNMLLKQSGTVLKICDFGTACHPHSEMSSTKGSASWMAPEVYRGAKYAEKCDVYSFGIILWQMLTRKKPFDGNPFQIMWNVSEGKRPFLINGIPSCLEILIQSFGIILWQMLTRKKPFDGNPFQIMWNVSEGKRPFLINGIPSCLEILIQSFGIILWQMLTRKKPFDGNPFQIMWNVSEGKRPFLINGIPSCLEILIQRCWQKEGKDRPAFVDIVKFLRKVNLYVSGGELPLMECAQSACKQPWVDNETKTSIPSKTNEGHIINTSQSVISESNPMSSMKQSPFIAISAPKISKRISSSYPEKFNPQIIQETLSTSIDSEIMSSVSIKKNNQERNIKSENISMSSISINEHYQLMPPKFSNPCQSQWNLIPPELMPICPLEDPRSYHIYENYMEALKKYISMQENIEFLKQRRDNLKKNIIDLSKEQTKNPCLADFIAAQESRQQLLDMHKMIKPLLENERAKFAKKSLINR